MDFLLVSDGVVSFINVLRYILLSLSFVGGLIIIIAVLLQNSNSGGADSVTGASFVQESYYSKHKGTTIDEKLSRVTRWCAIIVAVCILCYYLTLLVVSATV